MYVIQHALGDKAAVMAHANWMNGRDKKKDALFRNGLWLAQWQPNLKPNPLMMSREEAMKGDPNLKASFFELARPNPNGGPSLTLAPGGPFGRDGIAAMDMNSNNGALLQLRDRVASKRLQKLRKGKGERERDRDREGARARRRLQAQSGRATGEWTCRAISSSLLKKTKGPPAE